MRILIAEDDFTSRNILTAILRKWGYDPVVAEDGNSAWAALQRPDAPRLVLLDWNMPGIEGLEVCRRLRAEVSPNPPYVILLTGREEKGDIVQGLAAGANDYIAKPYDNGELQARIGVGKRMLELQAGLLEAKNALEHQAMHDPLTGVLNRRAILERLSVEISRAKRESGRFSVGMCDLDHFKKINDTRGHLAGDAVIVAFTRCVQATLRGYDCVGRYGGEEFLVLALGSGGQIDDRLFERVRAIVADTEVRTNVGAVSMTVSIGVVPGTGDSTLEALLGAADVALYQAKAAGRNRVVYADP